MKLARARGADGLIQPGVVSDETFIPFDSRTLTEVLEADDVRAAAEQASSGGSPIPLRDVRLLAPIERQEVWAAGVTYKRSRSARMEESEAAASCYDRVYQSPRPELFFKATPHRVAGPDRPLRIRADSEWNVPEPEVALVLDSKLRIVGYTVGNDMSSRDIEGDNPLYLPQAKVYDACCGLGPWITLADDMPRPEETEVILRIERDQNVVFGGAIRVDQMARTFEELVGWLGRDNSFPDGAFLLTGTGIVPDSPFTLAPGDVVHITIGGIGTLTNPVEQQTG